MYFRINNGEVVFPICVIQVNANLGGIKDFMGCSIYDNNKIVCYNLQEKDNTIEMINKRKLKYTIEGTAIEQGIKNKVKNIKYQNDIEAMDHIQNNIEPESQRIPNLLKRLDEAEAKNRLISDLIARLEKTENEVNSLKKLSIL